MISVKHLRRLLERGMWGISVTFFFYFFIYPDARAGGMFYRYPAVHHVCAVFDDDMANC